MSNSEIAAPDLFLKPSSHTVEQRNVLKRLLESRGVTRLTVVKDGESQTLTRHSDRWYFTCRRAPY
ncbi:MAG: hypothetical protein MUE52_06615 [Tabrizicola sp.]|jgi:hypothetical protein|nr:hypothetical protein [Tabrizicola sp.]